MSLNVYQRTDAAPAFVVWSSGDGYGECIVDETAARLRARQIAEADPAALVELRQGGRLLAVWHLGAYCDHTRRPGEVPAELARFRLVLLGCGAWLVVLAVVGGFVAATWYGLP